MWGLDTGQREHCLAKSNQNGAGRVTSPYGENQKETGSSPYVIYKNTLQMEVRS
jgi:hypothetical protein